MQTTVPVKDQIQANATELTPAERQLAGVLLRDYPMVGLQSITRLAESAGVSTPTVIRLARKLGYDGFPELQSALRDEASAQINAPSPALPRPRADRKRQGSKVSRRRCSKTFTPPSSS